MSTDDDTKPVYEWAVAEVGDRRKPTTSPVRKDQIDRYVKFTEDANPLFTDEAFAKRHGFKSVAVPTNMANRVASHYRKQLMREKGYSPPRRPTPMARLQWKLLAPMQVDDQITSECRVGELYEKRGRKYIVWEVTARNQNGEEIGVLRTTNSWEGAKPEDKKR